MAKQVQLARPPLREALLEIKLEQVLPDAFAEGIQNRRVPGLKYVNPVKQGKFSLQFGPAVSPHASTEEELWGGRFEAPDRSRVALLRRDGITCSIIGAYRDWEDLKNWSREMWSEYCSWAGKPAVQQLALRYINVIEIPVRRDFDEFLTSAPRIAPELPQIIGSFFQRIVIPFPEFGSHAIVTQATESTTDQAVSVVLDIDVQSPCKIIATDEEIWARFDKIRDIKNQIFFSSVTDQALERYQ